MILSLFFSLLFLATDLFFNDYRIKWLFKALAKTWGELAENFEASKGLVIAKVYSIYEDDDDHYLCYFGYIFHHCNVTQHKLKHDMVVPNI